MPKFTQQVLDFVHDFVIEDIQKVLKCSYDDAMETLHRIVTHPVEQRGGDTVKKPAGTARQFNRTKSLVVERTPSAPPKFERVEGEYSNKNAWDKYN